jgi:hypothetical protein
MLLFFIGCVLTFNLGRDITLITLYPFVFGYVMLTIWAQVHGEKRSTEKNELQGSHFSRVDRS